MKRTAFALVLTVIAGTYAHAQTTVVAEPVDKLTAGYEACVRQQVRDGSAPRTLGTTRGYRYVGEAAEHCPGIEADFIARQNTTRDAADLAAIRAAKKAPK